MLESPSTAGGDTLVSSSVRAYTSLSPRFRKRLEGLTAIHTNNDGVGAELKHGEKAVMRRGVLQAEHPVVLVHPVTKEKALCMLQSISPSQNSTDHLKTSIQSTPNASSDSTRKNQTVSCASCSTTLPNARIFPAGSDMKQAPF